MAEFFLDTIRGPNLFATILLGLVLLYWGSMIFGIFGMDLDADLEIGVDTDLDADFDGHIDGGIAADVLTFFHIGEVPIMILGSFFVLFYWVTTMLSNHYFNADWSMMIALYAVIPNLIVSLFITKFVIWPLTPVFKGMKGTASTKVIGNRGFVTTLTLDGKHGQVSIDQTNNDGPPIVVNAITENGQKLNKNQEIKVIRFEDETGVYIVEPVKPEKI